MPDEIEIVFLTVLNWTYVLRQNLETQLLFVMTSPFSCSAASSGLPRLFHMSKPSSKWGPSSPGQELLCVSRRKFANLDLLRIRHFEKFDFRSDTHGTGLILGKYQTGNRAIWLVEFLYQPSQEFSRVIIQHTTRFSGWSKSIWGDLWIRPLFTLWYGARPWSATRDKLRTSLTTRVGRLWLGDSFRKQLIEGAFLVAKFLHNCVEEL